MPSAAYLDYNAGAPVRPQVIAAVAEVLASGGNPSSVHGWGRRIKAKIDQARMEVARLVDADSRGVVFTSCGTEANNMAVSGCGRARVLASAIEHPSVIMACPGAERIPVLPSGVVDLEALDRMLGEDGSDALVSVMWANNETGVLQPVEEVVRIAHAKGALVHCDAAQAVGRVSVSVSDVGVDFLTLSGPKLGAPSGIGAFITKDPDFRVAPMLLGGGQERRRRAGTENVSGIVGLGCAATIAEGEMQNRTAQTALRDLRDRLEAEITARVPGARVIGPGQDRLDNTSCICLPGVDAMTQVMALDLAGVMVGAGSACSSGKMDKSAVLAAMGLDDAVVRSCIRVSLGWGSGPADVSKFLAAWTDLAGRKGFEVRAADAAA